MSKTERRKFSSRYNKNIKAALSEKYEDDRSNFLGGTKIIITIEKTNCSQRNDEKSDNKDKKEVMSKPIF
jgi:hypothetical protein